MNLTPLFICIALFVAPFKATMDNEALWSPLICAILLLFGTIEGISSLKKNEKPSYPLAAALIFGYAAWSLIALLKSWLVVHHGQPVYLDPMIRSFSLICSGAVFATLLQRAFKRSNSLWWPVFALVFSAGLSSIYGVSDYADHVYRQKIADWREFGTTFNPDFFAAYLVTTIPLSISMFLSPARRKSIVGPLFWGIMAGAQILAISTTGSRFGLMVSLEAAMIVFIAAVFLARKGGLTLDKSLRYRALVLVVFALISGFWAARPLFHRFQSGAASQQANSGHFRVWTWKGAIRLFKANPIFGTGPGTFIYTYQKYGYVGYTRLAHNSYLQAAGETGAPGVLLAVVSLATVGIIGLRSLPLPETPERETDQSETIVSEPSKRRKGQPAQVSSDSHAPDLRQTVCNIFFPSSSKMLICGLLGSLTGACIQNLADSNWSLVFTFITLWFVCGSILACASKTKQEEPSEEKTPSSLYKGLTLTASILSALLAFTMIVFAKAESSAQLGEAKSENIGAYDSLQPSYDAYQDAIATNSLRADYFSFLALYLDSSSSPSNTEKDFKRAFFLEPNGLNALRYAQWLLSVGRPGDASRALDKGIEIEPNFAKLWNMKAKSMLAQGDIKGAEEAYLRIVSLQNGLVGKVPAIGDVVSLDYLDADIYLGNKAFARKDYKATTGYLSRAEQTLYTYADEKGSNNAMRMSTHHYSPDADGDSLKQSQYAQIADTLIAMAAQQHNPSQVSALSQRKQIAITAFENNIATAKNFKM